MASAAVALVNAAGVIVARGAATGRRPARRQRISHLIVIIPADLPADALTLGQVITARYSLHMQYAGVVEAFGTTSAGARTVTIALDGR